MKYEIQFKSGIRLTSKEDLVKTLYNNTDIEKVVLQQGDKKFALNLTPGMRLIFFRDIKIGNSPDETIHNLGFQKTIRGRNMKAIMKIFPNGNVVLMDG